jgi:hypothetical protein
MGAFGGFRKHEGKKTKKKDLERKAQKKMGSAWSLPQVEIIKKGKKDW